MGYIMYADTNSDRFEEYITLASICIVASPTRVLVYRRESVTIHKLPGITDGIR